MTGSVTFQETKMLISSALPMRDVNSPTGSLLRPDCWPKPLCLESKTSRTWRRPDRCRWWTAARYTLQDKHRKRRIVGISKVNLWAKKHTTGSTLGFGTNNTFKNTSYRSYQGNQVTPKALFDLANTPTHRFTPTCTPLCFQKTISQRHLSLV